MKQAINAILFLILLSVIAAMLFMPLAHATGTPQVDPASSVASSTASAAAKASSQSSSAIDLSLMNAPTQSYRGGESYALAAPAAAAPLPSGLCPKGDSESFSIIWGLVSWAKSSTRTEMECLDKVLAMLGATAQKPVVVNYIQPTPPVDPKPAVVPVEPARLVGDAPAACEPPVNTKPKPAAPKKHVNAPKVCK